MYLPLTGYNRLYKEKRGVEVSIGSIGNSAGVGHTMSAGRAAVQPASQPSAQISTNSQQDNSMHNVNNSHSHHNSNMCTEDFLSLHNSAAEANLEAVRDIMALKMIEKVLETINDIMK